MKCEICGKEFKNIGLLGRHIRFCKITSKEYYDKYIKKDDEGICPVCGEETKFQSLTKGYYRLCGGNCKYKDKETKKKRKETNIKKYGVENVSQLNDVKNKKRDTLINTFSSFDNYKDILSNNMKNNNPMHDDVIRNKHKDIMNDENLKEKIRKSSMESRRVNYYKIFNLKLNLKNIKYLSSKQMYLERNDDLEFECTSCNRIWKQEYNNPQNIHCICNRSYKETELENYIKTLNVEVESGKRFYLSDEDKEIYDKLYNEIDIFLPDYNLGIEYNGMYWHSELKVDEDYHQKKKLYFQSKGIDLIQVFGCDWINKQDIVKSIIRSRIGLNKKIYARKTTIKEINKQDYESFLTKYHIQGYVKSKYKLGMFHNDEMISVYGFGKNRFEDGMELIRYASKSDITIVGGFSKFSKYLKKYDIDEMISYVDLNYFNGNGYLKTGFEIIETTKPGYLYIQKNKPTITYHRQEFMKHLLKDKLNKFDDNMTERENMLNNGYIRVYNAGNLKVKINIKAL